MMRAGAWHARAAACAMVPVFAACVSDASKSVAPSAGIQLLGTLERGAWVHAALLDSVDAPVATTVAVSVTPASAALVSGDSLKWLQAGNATLRVAALVRGDSLVRTLLVTVAAPPLIVFDGVRTVAGVGNRDLFAVALDGLDLVRLTTDGLEDYGPTVRGGIVVFVSTRSGSRELWRQPLAGGAAVRITTNGFEESDPRLSPDGTRIAYADFNGGFPRVRLVNLTGTGDTRWIPADGAPLSVEASPAWSPTGDRIAYVTTREGNAGIWVGTTAGASASAVRLVGGAGTGNNVEPSWSPDGAEIVFASDRNSGTDLYVITLATGVTQRLTTVGTVGQPAWLSDGRIVFRDYAGGVNRLFWVRRTASGPRTLVDVGSEGGEHPQPAR